MSELVKITIRLLESDLEQLRAFYPRAGYNAIIRQLVSRHITELHRKQPTEGEIELEVTPEVEDIIE